ncbi:MAG: hypothetical protein FJY65_11150 [Calditrichaeota bacterium]|nr:hypothetical protein [Calditrichota bacterium]
MKSISQILFRLKAIFAGWGFTTAEKRALWLLSALILLGSGVRFYKNQRIVSEMQLAAAIDSSQVPHAALSVPSPDNPLDLNRATQAELETLPGIGPVKASRIVEYRRQRGKIENLNELLDIEDIGPKTLERLRPLLVISKP